MNPPEYLLLALWCQLAHLCSEALNGVALRVVHLIPHLLHSCPTTSQTATLQAIDVLPTVFNHELNEMVVTEDDCCQTKQVLTAPFILKIWNIVQMCQSPSDKYIQNCNFQLLSIVLLNSIISAFMPPNISKTGKHWGMDSFTKVLIIKRFMPYKSCPGNNYLLIRNVL